MGKQIGIALAVLAVLGVALFAMKGGQPRGIDAPDFSFPQADDVTAIRFEHDGVSYHFEQTADGWSMLEPVAFAANDGRVTEITELFARPHTVVISQPADRASANGFDDAIPLTVEGPDGTIFAGEVGGVARSGESTWVRVDGDDSLYRINADLRTPFEQGTQAYRDMGIFGVHSADVTEVVLHAGPHDVTLTRQDSDSDWSVAEDSGADGSVGVDIVLDPAAINQVVSGLASLTATSIADDVQVADSGVSDVSARITLATADTRVTVALGSENVGVDGARSTFYVVREGMDAVFVTNITAANRIRSELGDLRSAAVLNGDVLNLASIERRTGDTLELAIAQAPAPDGDEGEVTLTWTMSAPVDGADLNSSNINRYARFVAELEAERYPSEVPVDAFVEPVTTVRFAFNDGTAHELRIGAHVVPPTDEGAEAERYAQLDGGEVFVLARTRSATLLVDPMGATGLIATGEGDGE